MKSLERVMRLFQHTKMICAPTSNYVEVLGMFEIFLTKRKTNRHNEGLETNNLHGFEIKDSEIIFFNIANIVDKEVAQMNFNSME